MTSFEDTLVPGPYRVAAIQFEPRLFAKAENLDALLALTEEAARGGAKLIVTPEMATTAYCWANRDEVAGEVEPVPGDTTNRFAEIAARHGCWIVVGLAEVDPETDIYYNSAVLIGPDGPVGLYRKSHAFISERSGRRMATSVCRFLRHRWATSRSRSAWMPVIPRQRGYQRWPGRT